MGIINGMVYFTGDINEALKMLQQNNSNKCLFVGDSMGKYDALFTQYGIISASVLMPDLIGMEADINGTPLEFRDKYFNYLNSEIPKSMIATIITALYQGKNIILFVPPEANGLNYPMVLLDYICTFHGITVSCPDKRISFNYNPAFDLTNADCMYAFSTIGPAEYLMIAGPNFDMISKLCYDTNMGFGNMDPQSIRAYFANWQNNMLSGGKTTIKPFGFTFS